jgi:FtsH-binding integral membrane protein
MIDYTKSFVKDKGSFDEGLRNYMLKIYNFIAIGLLVTGVFAFSTLNFPPLASLMFNIGPNGEFMGTSGLGMLISFAPLGIAIYFFMGLGRMSVNTAQTLFWVYAAVMGMSLS